MPILLGKVLKLGGKSALLSYVILIFHAKDGISFHKEDNLLIY